MKKVLVLKPYWRGESWLLQSECEALHSLLGSDLELSVWWFDKYLWEMESSKYVHYDELYRQVLPFLLTSSYDVIALPQGEGGWLALAELLQKGHGAPYEIIYYKERRYHKLEQVTVDSSEIVSKGQ